MPQKCAEFVRSKHEFHCITQLNVCWQHKEMERRKGSFVRQCHDSSTQSDHEERSCTIGNRWKWRCGRSGAWRVNKQKIRETEREPQVENERQRWAHTLTVEIVSRVSTEHVDCGGMTAVWPRYPEPSGETVESYCLRLCFVDQPSLDAYAERPSDWKRQCSTVVNYSDISKQQLPLSSKEDETNTF